MNNKAQICIRLDHEERAKFRKALLDKNVNAQRLILSFIDMFMEENHDRTTKATINKLVERSRTARAQYVLSL